MTDYIITSGRSIAYPDQHYGGHFVGNRATFCLPADFAGFDDHVLAIPNLPIRVLSATPVKVDEYFFGMHVRHRANDIMPEVTARSVRAHDISGGGTRWQKIEPSKGVYDWKECDKWVNTHYSAARDLVFVLFGTPTWASARPTEISAYSVGAPGLSAEPVDLGNWSSFCSAVATRYRGKIKYYEVWNEANGPGFYTGTKSIMAQMVRRANQAIKAVDPAAKIISPSITGWGPNAGAPPEIYFGEMMGASDGEGGTMADWIDIVGVHLYLYLNRTQELAGVINRINAAKAAAGLSALPTWDTESAPGSPYIAGMSDEAANRHINRSLLVMAAMGIGRTFYYLYDSSPMGINDRAEIVKDRNRVCDLLISGEIQSVYQFTDGRVVYHANDKTVII